MYQKQCRICLESDEGEMIAPCNCIGDTKYVHRECLNKWRLENIDNDKFSKCEICQEDYAIINNLNTNLCRIFLKCISSIGIYTLFFVITLINTIHYILFNYIYIISDFTNKKHTNQFIISTMISIFVSVFILIYYGK